MPQTFRGQSAENKDSVKLLLAALPSPDKGAPQLVAAQHSQALDPIKASEASVDPEITPTVEQLVPSGADVSTDLDTAALVASAAIPAMDIARPQSAGKPILQDPSIPNAISILPERAANVVPSAGAIALQQTSVLGSAVEPMTLAQSSPNTVSNVPEETSAGAAIRPVARTPFPVGEATAILAAPSKAPSAPIDAGERPPVTQTTGSLSPQIKSKSTPTEILTEKPRQDTRQTLSVGDGRKAPRLMMAETRPLSEPSQGRPEPQPSVANNNAKTAQEAAVPPSVLSALVAHELIPNQRRVIVKSQFARIQSENSARSAKAELAPLAGQAKQPELSMHGGTGPERLQASDPSKTTFLTDQTNTKASSTQPAPVTMQTPDIPAERAADMLPLLRFETATTQTIRTEEAASKAIPKPFADALISQIRSVDISQGRTVVNLHPRGLGMIEVEVIAEKELASKVVVRVENPVVLQALRDERQLLAQTIGVADSSVLEFQDSDTGAHSGGGQDQGTQTDDAVGSFGTDNLPRQHRDVVDHGQLDILT